MKKSLFILLFATIVAKGFGQLFPPLSYPGSVGLFGLYEVSFTLPTTYSNPYDPDTINVYAEFTGPDNSSYIVNAFYYEDYTFYQHVEGYEVAVRHSENDGWRLRFTPTVVGTWSFYIRAFDKNGELNLPELNANHTFSCTSVSDVDGFISLANSRFLKRDIVKNGNRRFHSFFPIGPDEAWYSCMANVYGEFWNHPKGIYDYKRRIDSLSGNANYMRVFLNRYKSLALYGPEYATENGDTIVCFDSTVNQKDSAELDYIIAYASQHGISVMPCIFNCADFMAGHNDPSDPSIWANNPFRYILGNANNCACSFFTDARAIKISKNLIRYIVSRWGYATNIMSWELWNEVDHVKKQCPENHEFAQQVKDWHREMDTYIRSIDPFGHCISSSVGNPEAQSLFPDMYQNSMDIVQRHIYGDIQRARSYFEIPYLLYIRTNSAHNYSMIESKPFFMGEFGFDQSKHPYTEEKDPLGVSLHNSLWSSLFSASIGPASFWWWKYLDLCSMYKRFTPLKTFCQNLPILSGTFTANTTGESIDNINVVRFPNGLGTYYMTNTAEDTIMGWCQDTAFAYQSLRWLTDSVRMQYDTLNNGQILKPFYFVDNVPPLDPNGYIYTLDPLKRPAPSSNSNVITLPIINQPVGTTYKLRWYDSETGLSNNEIILGPTVQQDFQGNKFLSFHFPSHIRDLNKQTINNTFGDAVFVLIRIDPGGPLPKE